MTTVTVSPKYQVVIPREKKVQVLQYQNRIEFIPVRPIAQMRGFLKGIDTTIEREPDRL